MTTTPPLSGSEVSARVREALAALLDALPDPTAPGSAARAFLDDLSQVGARYMVVRRPTSALALSEREYQVLARAAEGERNKEIAFALGVADSTVRVLLHRAARKLGARGRRDALTRFAAGK